MKFEDVRVNLLLNDSDGIYIPHHFLMRYENVLCDENGDKLKGTLLNDLLIIEDMNSILYWEAWENVLNNVYIKDDDGEIYMLHHNQDLWAINKSDIDSLNESESDQFWANYTD